MRAYYIADKVQFDTASNDLIIGQLSQAHQHDLRSDQTYAWLEQLPVLRQSLSNCDRFTLLLEYSIPRMGKRIDAVILLDGAVIVLEFKTEAKFTRDALDQVEDYALDLKNFHAQSHHLPIIPILVAMGASQSPPTQIELAIDQVALPICLCKKDLAANILAIDQQYASSLINHADWINSGYRPTPTIIESAKAMYARHDVEDLRNFDAGAINLSRTQDVINRVIHKSKAESRKSICFITGVPGAGKTLAGLDVASKRADSKAETHAVFLSGNGPLVDVLREALTRDEASRNKIKKNIAERKVKSFIQPIHHWRDLYVQDMNAPNDHIVVFDEAQRAWTREKASSFMRQKKRILDFDQSEPQFLLSVMDRHQVWCTVVCLIGGGQEINTGEAGITEWFSALSTNYPHWDVYVSCHITHNDYVLGEHDLAYLSTQQVSQEDDLHLNVSMRSFRAEMVSEFISLLLDGNQSSAKTNYEKLRDKYSIRLTRDISVARKWLKSMARGTERYGLTASSGAKRLKPEGLFVKSGRDGLDPTSWFLNDRDDVRSSFALEDVATEFDVQGLELDWVGVCWDADFRRSKGRWVHQKFQGTKWRSVHSEFDQRYLKNAYRVILTRARQGMVIYVPKGDNADHTRPASYYDETYAYLSDCGLTDISDDELTKIRPQLLETGSLF